MSRGNIVLLLVLALAVGLWLLGRNWAHDKKTAPAARLFPEINREGADRIEISGGPSGTAFAIRKENSDWSLASAGDYPVKRAEVDRFLDAVSSLRKDNAVGASADLRARTQTDEKSGRLVRVLRGEQPMAEFYVGKNPKQGYSEFFVRKAGDDTVYRTYTLLTKEREGSMSLDPESQGPSGFDWHNYTEGLSTKWVDPVIWDLGSAEVEEIWLTRKDLFDAKVLKQAQDKWDLVEEGKESVPADADVADGILSIVRRLSLYEVLGTYEEVAKEYGLDAPETTLVMKLRKKAEKPAPKEGEPKEGEEKKEEYTTFHRSIEIGKKISRPRYDSYSDEMKSDDYYAIHVGPEGDMDDVGEKKRAGFVFLVRDYTASQIRKDLADLAAKPKEGEEKGPGEGEGEGGAAMPGEEKPPEEKPGDQKPEDEKPADEKPADEKPEGDGGKEQPAGGDKDTGGDDKDGCGKDAGCGEGCGCGEPEGCG